MLVVSAERKDEVKGARNRNYMYTEVHLVVPGLFGHTVTGQTRIWTRQPWIGYTGAVRVVAVNADGIMLDFTQKEHRWGVDGFRIPFKASDRTLTWSDNMDPHKTATATSLEIIHYYAPKNRLKAMLSEAVQIGKDIKEFLEEVDRMSG